jgi:ribosomal RNA assembly protein
MSTTQELKVPKERVAIIIGKSGIEKRRIEHQTHTKLTVTKDGEVTIAAEDPLQAWNARQIIKAIGRGFSPDVALLLTDEEYLFEVIDLKEWAGKNEKMLKRLKGRVIGEQGKSRQIIEELTESYISVYGKTISIIGETTRIQTAKRAVELLLDGARHATVYKILEKAHKEWKQQEIIGENVG